ncbi:MAG: phosphoserine phosphatase SerB [Leptospiraceae bacterium]|nr:phosphoserine phosphatase SerB [Leptospiraceae bacterium]
MALSLTKNTAQIKNEILEFGINPEFIDRKVIGNTNGLYFAIEGIKDFNEKELRENLKSGEIDILFLEDFLDKTQKALFVFDMDSTLIKEEVIDELARQNGVYEKVAEVTEKAMQGELDFNEALKMRCSHLKGIHENAFEKIFQSIHPNQGVELFLKEVKEFPSVLAVFSGGFIPVVERFAKKFGFDEFRANKLEVKDNLLTGEVIGEIVNKTKKKEYLLEVKEKYSIENSQVIAIGDGSNDSEMLLSANLGIGFHPKEGLKSHLRNWVDFVGMETLLFLYM